MRFRKRFDVINIEGGASDRAVLQCVDQRVFIDQWSARRVDEIGARSHQIKLGCADNAFCAAPKDQVSSIAPWDEYPVPQIVMPRSCAASRSIDALRAPVEASSFRLGNCSSIEREKGVRSRMTHTTSNGFSRSTSAVRSDR